MCSLPKKQMQLKEKTVVLRRIGMTQKKKNTLPVLWLNKSKEERTGLPSFLDLQGDKAIPGWVTSNPNLLKIFAAISSFPEDGSQERSGGENLFSLFVSSCTCDTWEEIFLREPWQLRSKTAEMKYVHQSHEWDVI